MMKQVHTSGRADSNASVVTRSAGIATVMTAATAKGGGSKSNETDTCLDSTFEDHHESHSSSSSYYDDCSSSCSSSSWDDEEEEEYLRQVGVASASAAAVEFPSSMLQAEQLATMLRGLRAQSAAAATSVAAGGDCGDGKSSSTRDLYRAKSDSALVKIVGSSSEADDCAETKKARAARRRASMPMMMKPQEAVDPQKYLLTIASQADGDKQQQELPPILPRCAMELTDDFFLPPTRPQLDAYHDGTAQVVLKAIRYDDLTTLRKLHVAGRPVQCCNRFGESSLHLACRLNRIGIVRYMVEELGVNVRARDDCGRTPLHDACWTANEPALELVEFLIGVDGPDMLWVSDSRGTTPLGYVRREHWPVWCDFLDEFVKEDDAGGATGGAEALRPKEVERFLFGG